MTRAAACRIMMFSRSLGEGGAPRVMYNLARHLVNQNVVDAIRVYYFQSPEDLAPAFERAGIQTARLNGGVRLPSELWREIESYQPDVLHTHMMAASAVGRPVGWLRGVPVVSTIHAMYDNRRLAARLPDLVTSPFASAIVPVSNAAAESLPIWFAPLSATQQRVIHNGIDCDRVRERADVSWYDLSWNNEIDPDDPIIANVSRYDPKKRRIDLVRAFPAVLERYPNAQLVLTGWGDTEAIRSIDRLANRLGVQESLHQVGMVDDPYPVYHHADVAVLCSESESFGIGIIEAGAIGTPLVATDIPAFREVLGSDYPLMPVRSPPSLANGIIELLDDEFERQYLARMVRKRVESQFSNDVAATEYIKLYRSLLR